MRMIGASFANWQDDYYDGVENEDSEYCDLELEMYIEYMNDTSDDYLLALKRLGGKNNQSR
ncbi:hypothetical protein NBRC13296_12220 [Paenibacillus chitinolyticus]|uniref:hypothetical protein n=1 Tax=Paenibacillus chitinolyticus TaxID=79263 RepID=UPI003557837E